ncbi:MAG: alpha/beta hydrolase [Solobacterium sp.]|nr:alpha/beta hydrolase [Solobacterium sp.]
MNKLVLYIHGKGGSASESSHYKTIFHDSIVIGLDYKEDVPWKTGKEIFDEVKRLHEEYESITLIANSIGAYYSMISGIDPMIYKAYFISPIVNMEKLILDMMIWADVSEEDLKTKGIIPTSFGENLSWEYLCYVREHPVQWNVPTEILYGENDNLTSLETIKTFVKIHHAGLIVMEKGEHWFHTPEQMKFLDEWIRSKENHE